MTDNTWMWAALQNLGPVVCFISEGLADCKGLYPQPTAIFESLLVQNHQHFAWEKKTWIPTPSATIAWGVLRAPGVFGASKIFSTLNDCSICFVCPLSTGLTNIIPYFGLWRWVETTQHLLVATLRAWPKVCNNTQEAPFPWFHSIGPTGNGSKTLLAEWFFHNPAGQKPFRWTRVWWVLPQNWMPSFL